MSPEKIKKDVNHVHSNITEIVSGLVKAAKEIKVMTEDGFNPKLSDLLAPLYYCSATDEDFSLGFDVPTDVKTYKSATF